MRPRRRHPSPTRPRRPRHPPLRPRRHPLAQSVPWPGHLRCLAAVVPAFRARVTPPFARAPRTSPATQPDPPAAPRTLTRPATPARAAKRRLVATVPSSRARFAKPPSLAFHVRRQRHHPFSPAPHCPLVRSLPPAPGNCADARTRVAPLPPAAPAIHVRGTRTRDARRCATLAI
jgi:hypothetical protein